jgi:hypothetical protein
MALQPFWTLPIFFSFLILYTVRRTPWTGDQPVARPLPTHRTIQAQNKRTQAPMPRVGFKTTTPAFMRAKTFRALRTRGHCGLLLAHQNVILLIPLLINGHLNLFLLCSLALFPCSPISLSIFTISVTVEGVWIDYRIYWIFNVEFLCVSSVTVFTALLANVFQRWTFLCSRGSRPRRLAAISHQIPILLTAISRLSLIGRWSSLYSLGTDSTGNTASKSYSIVASYTAVI